MGRRSFQISVYPQPEAVATLGGYHAPLLNRALQCCADLLTQASTNLETQRSRADWCLLAEALKDTALEAYSPNLSEHLAEAVDNAAKRDGLAFSVYGNRADERAQKLAVKVRSLDAHFAWAVVWAVQWLWQYGLDVDPASSEWWKPEFRKIRARPYGPGKRKQMRAR